MNFCVFVIRNESGTVKRKWHCQKKVALSKESGTVKQSSHDRGALIMIIIIGNGIGHPSSISTWVCLHFTSG